jgi:hypothetical protein
MATSNFGMAMGCSRPELQRQITVDPAANKPKGGVSRTHLPLICPLKPNVR